MEIVTTEKSREGLLHHLYTSGNKENGDDSTPPPPPPRRGSRLAKKSVFMNTVKKSRLIELSRLFPAFLYFEYRLRTTNLLSDGQVPTDPSSGPSSVIFP
jgi:hypothetical protein